MYECNAWAWRVQIIGMVRRASEEGLYVVLFLFVIDSTTDTVNSRNDWTMTILIGQFYHFTIMNALSDTL